MQTTVIDIHPYDMGNILNNDPDPEVILWRDTLVEHQGKFYRQTVKAPVTSEYGKAFEAKAAENITVK